MIACLNILFSTHVFYKLCRTNWLSNVRTLDFTYRLGIVFVVHVLGGGEQHHVYQSLSPSTGNVSHTLVYMVIKCFENAVHRMWRGIMTFAHLYTFCGESLKRFHISVIMPVLYLSTKWSITINKCPIKIAYCCFKGTKETFKTHLLAAITLWLKQYQLDQKLLACRLVVSFWVSLPLDPD